jgi:hypothetical protein
MPIIVYTGRELSKKQETRLRRLSETIIIKDVSSPERILAETALFLHRVEANMPEAKRRILEKGFDVDPELAGRRVLIVDDDVRNIFALTSLLEHHAMNVKHAEDGSEALDLLAQDPKVDLVLMDIMMPGMDGFETIKAVRSMPQHADLPIIALTAKAMKGDREKCLEAGASDYITKPVDVSQLLSLMRVWLYRSPASDSRASRPPVLDLSSSAPDFGDGAPS